MLVAVVSRCVPVGSVACKSSLALWCTSVCLALLVLVCCGKAPVRSGFFLKVSGVLVVIGPRVPEASVIFLCFSTP